MLSNIDGQTSQHRILNHSALTAVAMRAALMLALATVFAQGMPTAKAQSGFFNSWERRVNKIVSQQPSWPVPVATPSSGLGRVNTISI